MSARSIFAAVMAEAGRLGLAWWERVALILAAALLVVMGRAAREVLRNIPIEPQPLDPERDPSLPDAVGVDANGTPVGSGPPPEGESGSGG